MENDFKKDFSYSDANDQSYNSSEELMQQALPLYDLSDNENPLPEKTLQAYEFLKKGKRNAFYLLLYKILKGD